MTAEQKEALMDYLNSQEPEALGCVSVITLVKGGAILSVMGENHFAEMMGSALSEKITTDGENVH